MILSMSLPIRRFLKQPIEGLVTVELVMVSLIVLGYA